MVGQGRRPGRSNDGDGPSSRACCIYQERTGRAPDAKVLPGARAFVLLRRPRYFTFACPRARRMRVRTAKLARRAKGGMPGVKEKYPRENDPSLGACRPCMGGKSVSRGEKASASMPLLAARPVDSDSPPRKGPRVEQRAIPSRTRCATAARSRERKSRDAKHSIRRVAWCC